MGNNHTQSNNKQQKQQQDNQKNKVQDKSETINSVQQESMSNIVLNEKDSAAHSKFFKGKQSYQMLGVSLVIARNNQGKFLAVKENYDQGWWIPGGLVDPPEDFVTAAIRETQEEAGIDIEIKGILRIEQNFNKNARYKVVFYGEPKDQNQIPKQIPDAETQEARWVTLQELQELGKHPPYLRGKELLNFGSYLQQGGPIYPLSVIETIYVNQFIHKPLQNQLQQQNKIPNTIQQKQIQQPQQSQQQLQHEQQIIQEKINFLKQQKECPSFETRMTDAPLCSMIGLSLIVIRNKENKFLAVKEARNRGWWLPGGKVDPPEDFITAGCREAKEEAGIDVEIKGVLRIEQDFRPRFFRYKVVFYAEPIDENQKPKDFADNESEEARWVTLPELQALGKKKPYLRGEELLEFGKYLENGGPIYPLSVLNTLNIK